MITSLRLTTARFNDTLLLSIVLFFSSSLLPVGALAQTASFTINPTATPDLQQTITLDGTASSGDNYVWTLDGTRIRSGSVGDGGLTFDTTFTNTGQRILRLLVTEQNRCDIRDPNCVPIEADSTSKTITVQNPPPNAADDQYSTPENATRTGDVLDNDSDPNGDNLSATKLSDPSSGHVSSFNSDGSFTFDPNGEFETLGRNESQTVSFDYRATDGRGGSDPATVSVTIQGRNDGPTASNASLTTLEDESGSVDLSGSVNDIEESDADLTLSIVNQPSHGSASVTGLQATYTPTGNYSGSDSFTYRVSDGLESATATVSVTVTPVNDAPTASDVSVSTDEDQSATFDLSNHVSDPETEDGRLSLSVISGPSHGSITDVSGLEVTYTPDANYNGSDSFEYEVTDTGGKTATASVMVTIDAVNAKPTASDATLTTTEDESATVDLSSNVDDEETSDSELSLSIESAPSHGQTSVSGLEISYTPDEDYNGSDTFTYKVSDGVKSATASVDVTITQRPDISFVDGRAYTPPTPTPGDDRNPIGRFALRSDEPTKGGIRAALTSLTIENISSSGTSGIVELEIWRSNDASFDPISGSDSEVAATSYASSSTQFSGSETFSMNEAIPTQGKKYLFVVVDLDGSATGGFRPAIPNQNTMSFVDGDLSVVNGTDDTTFSSAPLATGAAPLPVELASFESSLRRESVRLSWTTLSETDNAAFHVQRRRGVPGDGQRTEKDTDPLSNGTRRESRWAWTTIGTVKGAGTTAEPQTYRFTDDRPPYSADTLSYRLKQVDTNGQSTMSDPVVVHRQSSVVDVQSVAPNPARNRVTVRYAVPEKQKVTIRLYDVLGRQLQTVVASADQGRHVQTLDVSDVTSGLYLLRLRTGGTTTTQRLTVVK